MEDISEQQQHVIHQIERIVTQLEDDGRISSGEIQDVNEEVQEFLVNTDEELHPRFRDGWEYLREFLPEDFLDRRRAHRRHRRTQPRLDDIDEVIQERSPLSIPDIDISDDDNVVFFLGAGASVASDIPTVKGLLDVLLDQARRTRREDLEPLIEYCDNQEDIDIEDLLTAAYLSNFAVSDRHITRLLHYFLFSDEDSPPEETPAADPTSVNFVQDTLRTLFGSITSAMIPKDPNQTHEAIREFVVEHPNSSIITTNYDYCMDQELLSHDIGLSSTIDGGNPDEYDQSVDLLKMHGSINWWYCESCQLVSNIPPSNVKNSLEDSEADYAVLGICPDCHGQRRPLLVPPISFKFLMFPPLIEIWNKAREKIISADYIIAVGYSFSDSDAYIYNLISKSMKGGEDSTMVLVDPNSDVTERLRSRFTAELGEFDPDERIFGLHEVSQNAVPQLVNDILYSDDNEGDGDTGTIVEDSGGASVDD